MRSILKNINDIKEIVAMQQSYAKVGGVLEPLEEPELMGDAADQCGIAQSPRSGCHALLPARPASARGIWRTN